MTETNAANTSPENEAKTDAGTDAAAKPAETRKSIRDLHGEGKDDPDTIELLKGAKVFFGDKPAEITLAFDDGTADVQLLDADEKVVRDKNDQPLWYPRVPTSQIFPR
jgi:hypothetical protein